MSTACANPFETPEELYELLRHAFLHRYPKGTNGQRRVFGLLFAQPEHDIVKSELARDVQYLHHRSRNAIDFFWAGYKMDLWQNFPEPPDDIDFKNWEFSPSKFNNIREYFEFKTKWCYSGGVDLLLTNSYLSSYGAQLDFSTAMEINLGELKRSGAIESMPEFFESICRHADKSAAENPTSSLSDTLGFSSGKSGLKRLLLAALPKKIGDEIDKTLKFVAKDISWDS